MILIKSIIFQIPSQISKTKRHWRNETWRRRPLSMSTASSQAKKVGKARLLFLLKPNFQVNTSINAHIFKKGRCFSLVSLSCSNLTNTMPSGAIK